MADIKVLDGGFSTQLSTHVGEKIDGDPLWTARFLATNPEAVVATHLDFLRAGSDIIQTNTYQASVGGFVQYLGVSEEESLELIQSAVDLTRKAITMYSKETRGNGNIPNNKPVIVGSCGPYGAVLHDASEYTGNYGPEVTPEVMSTWHRPRIDALTAAGVDFLALETIPNQYEARALIELLREYPNTKAWLSFSCSDDGKTIVDGSNFQEVALDCYKKAPSGQIVAIGVNCLAPKLVASLLKGVNDKAERRDFVPLVVYPNSGEKYTVTEGWKREGTSWQPLEDFVPDWLDLGVQYIGGCCRTYATDITKIRYEVNRWQKKQANSVRNHVK
ncbi:uncharacterized protein LOC105699360 [Orussus abietinus]|uniref:uncharacterized protein LOC105699360 n=1 Tax=Orussus abietinus TaxID=222816 RepID=UPI0006267919|nr:uncharacterized protein LOC105699360 [Orussus abietinus]XP_023289939.1 uncharacterized protein LOC105699360 [Orussus abietinus]XP_023289940.1 uncharacterized protein LOC105699360 [Orussus abietinus]XP_023289941.1 uncharacterized protein LOC105699360 [Orussus abietinus]XP_023289942.1 uncharacterized protein LOC105699360 [Orussus abietinus]XP_023289943.1 uncharacterized protein LOC105699360 [Orussus abietinus]